MSVLYLQNNDIVIPDTGDLIARNPVNSCLLAVSSYCTLGETATVAWAHITGSDSENFPGPITYTLLEEPINFGEGTVIASRSIDEIDTYWGTNLKESFCLFNPPTPYGWFFEARSGRKYVYDCKEYSPGFYALPSAQFEVPEYNQYPHSACVGLGSWDGIPKTVFYAISSLGSIGTGSYTAYQGTLEISYWSCDEIPLSGDWWVLRVYDDEGTLLFTKQFLETPPVITVTCA